MNQNTQFNPKIQRGEFKINLVNKYIDRIEKHGFFKVLSYNPYNIDDPGLLLYSFLDKKYIEDVSLSDFYNNLITLQHSHYNDTVDVQKNLDIRFGPGEYIVLENHPIRRKRDKIWVQHSCGHIYETTLYGLFDSRKQDRSVCKACAGKGPSLGELKIKEYLENNNIPYRYQYRNSLCKDKRPLPFDFGVFYKKDIKKLAALIEFDGQQHFEETIYSRSEDDLMKIQRHDIIKDLFCERYDIPLIRIHYSQENRVGEILRERLIC